MEVTFILQDKTARTVEAEPGWKLMEVAVDNAIPGIDGDCGGEAACATCNVYVAPEWRGVLPDLPERDLDRVLAVECAPAGETLVGDEAEISRGVGLERLHAARAHRLLEARRTSGARDLGAKQRRRVPPAGLGRGEQREEEVGRADVGRRTVRLDEV